MPGYPYGDGGSEITGGKVQWKEASGSWDTEADVSQSVVLGNCGICQYTITGLTNGVAYIVRVFATNALGDSPPSDELTSTPTAGTAFTLSGITRTNYPEDERGWVAAYTVTGSETAITWSLSGDDSDDFSIIANGSLRFDSRPNYQSPTDADGDNQYQVTVQASDGTQARTLQVTVVVNSRGLPIITGSAQVGRTLTADTSGITDADGLHNPDFTYQWIANDGVTDSDITGATASAYTLTDSEEGKTIKVRVTFTDDVRGVFTNYVVVSFSDDRSNPETLTSAATEAVAAAAPSNNPATGAPTISGTPQVGETLTADTSGIADEDGLDNASFSYQWLSTRDTEIDGATSSTYTIGADDEGKTIKVRVTFTDDAGNEETLTSAATAEVAPPPPPDEDVVEDGICDRTRQVREAILARLPGDGGCAGVTAADLAGITGDLELRGRDIEELQAGDFQGLTSLDQLFLANNDLTELPAGIFDGLAGLERLNVTRNGLTGLPAGVFDDLAGLEFLYIGKNGLDQLPPGVFGNLGNLTYLQLSNNDLGQLPEGVFQGLRSLENLRLRNNPGATFTLEAELERQGQSGVAVRVAEGVPFDLRVVLSVQGGTLSGTEVTIEAGNAASQPVVVTPDGDGPVTVSVMSAGFRDGNYNGVQTRGGGPLTLGETAAVNAPATGAPAISGTVQVGETLTVGTSGISDEDGMDNASFSYQWLADDADIAGATNSSYALADADEGKTVRVRVSFTDDAGNEETLTSAATDPVAARPNNPATGAPAIGGTAQVGETLTADTSGIADANGLDNASFSYQWLAGGAEIAGATSSTYALAEADEGRTVRVRVSFTDDAGHEETLTSGPTAAVAAAPTEPPAQPTGLTAEASHDSIVLTWDDPREGSITGYVILRRQHDTHAQGQFTTLVEDTGTAATTYTDAAVEPETRYTYRIKAINGAGTSERSRWFHVDTPAAPVPAQPAGLAAEASHDSIVLTWDDPRDGSVTGYVILRRNRDTDEKGRFTTLVEDTGTAATTYTDESVEPETRYTYRIKAINEHGTSERSRWLHVDTPAAPAPEPTPEPTPEPNSPATGAPAISGTPQVGETLTVDVLGIADEDGLDNATFTYQWLADDADIASATKSTYTLADADRGKAIKVRVGFTDDAGNEETLDSAATDPVASRPNSPATGAPTITGTAQVGETLTAETSGIADADGLENASFSYQWIAGDTDIPGATGSTYALAEADEGRTVRVRVSFTDDAGNEESVDSDPTDAVAAQNIPATGEPTISGTPQVGKTLTADVSGIADEDGLDNVSYAYQWLADDADIADATGSTYTLTGADRGKAIKVRVSFTDDRGNEETLTSAATDPVAAPASSGEEDAPVWSATLTVEWVYQGYGYYSTASKKAGSLTPDSFAVDGTTYTVTMIETSGWMYIGLDRELPFGFVLELDGAQFASGDASFNSYSYGNIYKWTGTGLRWKDGDTIEVRLLQASGDSGGS